MRGVCRPPRTLALGRSLVLSVIAEGVETEAQREFLAGAGCDSDQRYRLSRPLPVERFEASRAERAAVLVDG